MNRDHFNQQSLGGSLNGAVKRVSPHLAAAFLYLRSAGVCRAEL